jgi:hypothetical protein
MAMGICLSCGGSTGSEDMRVKRCPKCKRGGKKPGQAPETAVRNDAGASMARAVNALIERRLAERFAGMDTLDARIDAAIEARLRRLAEDLAAAAKG